MYKTYLALSLALATLLVACGVASDDEINLRPAPPALRPDVQQLQSPEQADDPSNVNPRPWYEHYDLNKLVVRIGPGDLASSRGAGPRIAATVATTRSSRQAYSRRIQNLKQVREQLLRENAALAAKLALQVKQPTSEELGTLRTQLGRLSAQQRRVMARTRAVEVEHQALLTMLAQKTVKADLESGN